MSKSRDRRTKEVKETFCVHVLNQLMDGYKQNNNKIASIMAKPDYLRTKEEKEDLTVSIIEEMIQKGDNKNLINKIAAVTSKQQKQKGEVELKSLLKLKVK